MARRSLNRDIYEAKVLNNPDKKAELLAKSPHRRHRKYVSRMVALGEKIGKKVLEAEAVDEKTV